MVSAVASTEDLRPLMESTVQQVVAEEFHGGALRNVGGKGGDGADEKGLVGELRVLGRHLCDAVASSLGKLSEDHKFVVSASFAPATNGSGLLVESSCLWDQANDSACCLEFEKADTRLIMSVFALRR